MESAHKSEEAVETGAFMVGGGYRSHKLKPYRKAAQAERQLEKANVNVLYQKSLQENPQFSSNLLSRWQQKQAIKKKYAAAKRTGQTAGNTAQAASKTGKAARTVKEKAQQAGAFVMRHKKGFLIAGVLFLIACMLMNTMSSCSMMAQSIGSVLSGTTYPSDDPEMLAVEADYAAREAQLQEEIDNIESSHPGYDEYRYDLGMIGHDPHELAAFLSAVLQGCWWNWRKVRWEMWAVIPTGAGMALTAAWNGAPASYPGAITRQEKVSRALQAVSGRAFRGSSLMDSGAHGGMRILLPAMPFSSIGTWTAAPTMWESLSALMAAVFIPWREIPAMPARSRVMT